MKSFLVSIILFAGLFAGFDADYIKGFDVVRASHTNITISAGEARNAANSFDMKSTATVAASIWATGVGGVDRGYIVSIAMYHVFIVGTKQLTYAVLTTNLAKPMLTNAKGNDLFNGWRYLASFKLISTNGATNASGVQTGIQIPGFKYTGIGNDATLVYDFGTQYFRALTDGTNTVATTVALGVPAQAYEAKVGYSVTRTTTNVTDSLFFGDISMIELNSAANNLPNGWKGVIDVPVTASAVKYKVQVETVKATVYVIGYKIKR